MTTAEQQKTAYCTKCKDTVGVQGTYEDTLKNGTLAERGKCVNCGTGTFKFIKRSA